MSTQMQASMTELTTMMNSNLIALRQEQQSMQNDGQDQFQQILTLLQSNSSGSTPSQQSQTTVGTQQSKNDMEQRTLSVCFNCSCKLNR